MLMKWMAIRLTLILTLSVSLPQIVAAHGGVVQEDDICVIKVSYLRAHFKVYQPRVSGHEQFCEDLPIASESVFVMEYLHDALAAMPIDFRIIRDVTGKGRFARMEDVEQIADLDGATVFYQPPVTEPDVFTVIHDFGEEGDFIGIVSATQPDTKKVYAAVFPFEVGYTGIGYWPFFVAVLVLLQLQYLFMSGKFKRWVARGGQGAARAEMAPPVWAPNAQRRDAEGPAARREGLRTAARAPAVRRRSRRTRGSSPRCRSSPGSRGRAGRSVPPHPENRARTRACAPRPGRDRSR